MKAESVREACSHSAWGVQSAHTLDLFIRRESDVCCLALVRHLVCLSWFYQYNEGWGFKSLRVNTDLIHMCKKIKYPWIIVTLLHIRVPSLFSVLHCLFKISRISSPDLCYAFEIWPWEKIAWWESDLIVCVSSLWVANYEQIWKECCQALLEIEWH